MDDHCRVWMLTVGPRPRWAIRVAVISARAHAASEAVAAWRRLSWQLVGSGVSCAAELLQLRPAGRQLLQLRQGGGRRSGADRCPAAPRPPAARDGAAVSPPRALCALFHEETSGARLPGQWGRGRRDQPGPGCLGPRDEAVTQPLSRVPHSVVEEARGSPIAKYIAEGTVPRLPPPHGLRVGCVCGCARACVPLCVRA